MKNSIIITLIGLFLSNCGSSSNDKNLPFLGRTQYENGDTIYHTIPEFSFMNQDSVVINNDSLMGKVYIADFFFTSCPDICPMMKTQMLRVYDNFKNVEDFQILSHTIDPEYDTIPLLKDFADKLGVGSKTWHFLHGEKSVVYEVGQKGYMVTAVEDKSAPGGYIHSGAFILVDRQQRIRGLYDGTKAEDVDKLMSDLPKLLNKP